MPGLPRIAEEDPLVHSAEEVTLLLGDIQTKHTYNPYRELLATDVIFGSDTVFAVTLNRDSVGRISSRTEKVDGDLRVAAFSYDSAGQLVSVAQDGLVTESYEYDANGNRLRLITGTGDVISTVDAQDRLLVYGATRYEYAPSGALLRKILDTDTTLYAYDALGNLRSVRLPTGTLVEYIVDAEGRRVGKKVNGVITRRWLYDGQLALVAEIDSVGQIKGRFGYGQRLNVPEYMIRDGLTYRIISDERNSVRLVVEASSGAVAQRIDYDTFGRVISNTNPGFQPFGFAGGLFDEHTGLVRFGARDYDAETGRWTATDPLLFAGGDPNLYRYASADPVNRVDPSGLSDYNLASLTQSLAIIGGWLGRRLLNIGLGAAGGCVGEALTNAVFNKVQYARSHRTSLHPRCSKGRHRRSVS